MASFRDEIRRRSASTGKDRDSSGGRTGSARRGEGSGRASAILERGSSRRRSSSRRESLVIEDPEENARPVRGRGRDRDRNTRGDKNNSTLYLYGGVGGVALLLIIGLVAMQLAPGGGKPRKSGKAGTEEAEEISSIEPYSSPREAEMMLREADSLFAKGRASNANAVRNKCYRECLEIARRVRETGGISDKTGQHANKLCYDASKCQTVK